MLRTVWSIHYYTLSVFVQNATHIKNGEAGRMPMTRQQQISTSYANFSWFVIHDSWLGQDAKRRCIQNWVNEQSWLKVHLDSSVWHDTRWHVWQEGNLVTLTLTEILDGIMKRRFGNFWGLLEFKAHNSVAQIVSLSCFQAICWYTFIDCYIALYRVLYCLRIYSRCCWRICFYSRIPIQVYTHDTPAYLFIYHTRVSDILLTRTHSCINTCEHILIHVPHTRADHLTHVC